MLDKRYKHDISVVVDRLVMRHDLRKRLADSIETAVGLAEGLVEIEIVGSGEGSEAEHEHATGAKGARARRDADRARRGSRARARSSPSPSASPARCTDRRWSSWSRGSSRSTPPTGRASTARGWARRWRSTPSWSCPIPSLSIAEGALAPWAGSSSNYYEQVTEAIAERYGVDLDVPWEDLPQEMRDLFLNGDRRAAGRSPIATASGAHAPMRRGSRGSSRAWSAATASPTRRGRKRRSSSSCRCAPARCAGARGCARSRARCSSGARRSTSSARCPPGGRWSGWRRSSCRRPTGTSRG